MKLGTGLTAVIIAGAGALLAACADEKALDAQYDSIELGRAVHEDMTAQIADPDVAYKGPPQPSSGEQAQIATERYKTNTVKQPAAQSSTQGISSGGGGGGGSPQ